MSNRVRGEGRVFLRGPVWWVAYNHRGREVRESTGINVARDSHGAKAGKLLRKRLGEKEAGTFVGPKQERVTYQKLEDTYFNDYAKQGNRSIKAARSRVKHLRAFFDPDGRARALDIAPDKLDLYQNHRLDEDASRATVNRELSALHRMFRLAVKQRLLSAIPSFPDKLKEAGPRQGFFEYNEFLAIREHLPPVFQDVISVLYGSGWRSREVADLKWEEVDLAGGVVRLDPSRSKSGKSRVLPITPMLRDVLKRREAARLVERDGDVHVSDLVFHQDGVRIGDWRKTWLRACIKAGFYVSVEDKQRPTKLVHDLRRTTVRDLVRSGVDEATAMRWTGHETRSVFESYNIGTEDDMKAAAVKLTNYRTARTATRRTR